MFFTRRETIERVRGAGCVAIVGAGFWGEKLLKQLLEDGRGPKITVFDNNRIGQDLCGHPIIKPFLLPDQECVYVVTPGDAEVRRLLCDQMLELGVKNEQLLVFYGSPYDRDYLCQLDPSCYQEAVGDMFLERFGRPLDWENPRTYNEIINWEKVRVKDVRRSQLADKYLAKQWVADRIGAEYVPELLGVWDSADDIDFDKLPDQFALKVNNASNRLFVVTDKTAVNIVEIRQKLNEWMEDNFAYSTLELHYTDIVPKIVCEEYIAGIGDDLYDYAVHCFGGEPEYIECIKACKKSNQASAFYDKEWNKQEFCHAYPMDEQSAPRPKQLEKMLELSRVLSREFPHVRVDWYITREGKILFSEMTFSTWSGLSPFIPEKYDSVFGELILSRRTEKNDWHPSPGEPLE